MKHIIAVMIAACSLAAFSIASAQTSDLVTYQGKLTDLAGTALPDGAYWLGARIWDTASGGTTPLWARKYQIPVSAGVFSLMLGATGTAWATPAPLTSSLKLAMAGGNRWVEITVMSDAGGTEKAQAEWKVLLPRQSLSSVPFALNGVPTGTVAAFAGSAAPDGWTLCDGLARDGGVPAFAALFQTVGLTDGGSGTSFLVPDLKGRAPIGAGQGGSLTNRTLAQKHGAETHTLLTSELPIHSHTLSASKVTTNFTGTHTHTVPHGPGDGEPRNKAADGEGAQQGPNVNTGANGGHSHTVSGTTDDAGNGSPHNNMQPSLVLNYIIKL